MGRIGESTEFWNLNDTKFFFLTGGKASVILQMILSNDNSLKHMPSKTNPQFISFLKEQGLRRTSGREEVFREAVATGDHFEPEELAYRLRKKGSRISKATVYRTLPLLVKAGLIKEVIHGEKHHHYEPIHGEKQHDHLICLECGKIVEFEEEELREIERKICEKNRFRPQKIVVEIFGYCGKCQ